MSKFQPRKHGRLKFPATKGVTKFFIQTQASNFQVGHLLACSRHHCIFTPTECSGNQSVLYLEHVNTNITFQKVSQKSHTRHMQIPRGFTFKCGKCTYTYLEDRLYIHFHGTRSKGYDEPCGKHFQWPGARAQHQDNCDECDKKKGKPKKKRSRHFSVYLLVTIYV